MTLDQVKKETASDPVGVRASDFHLWDRGFNSRYGLMWKGSVNTLPKVVGFLRELRFPPTGQVVRVG
jgi:hypothetical protein